MYQEQLKHMISLLLTSGTQFSSFLKSMLGVGSGLLLARVGRLQDSNNGLINILSANFCTLSSESERPSWWGSQPELHIQGVVEQMLELQSWAFPEEEGILIS